LQLLLAWALSNSFLVICILTGVNAKDTFSTTKVSKTRVYMTFVLAFVAIQNIIKFFGSTFFMCMVAITG
jgi:chitin synthase